MIARWKEVRWNYEKADAPVGTDSGRIDGGRFRDYAGRRIIRHEAESWEFKPGSVLEISLRNGQTLQAHWRLKGRGHVLTIRHGETGDVEVYDVKELDNDRLILHYDLGMEVRGIASLEFRRADAADLSADPPNDNMVSGLLRKTRGL